MKKLIFTLSMIFAAVTFFSCSKKQNSSDTKTEQAQIKITATQRFINTFMDDSLSQEDKDARLISICNEIAASDDAIDQVKTALHECTVQAVDAIVTGNRGAVPYIQRTSNALNNLVAELDAKEILISQEIMNFIQEDTKPLLEEAAAKLTEIIRQAAESKNTYLMLDCLQRAEEIGLGAFSPEHLEIIEKSTQLFSDLNKN